MQSIVFDLPFAGLADVFIKLSQLEYIENAMKTGLDFPGFPNLNISYTVLAITNARITEKSVLELQDHEIMSYV